jgi:lipopolysaccharide transport protein LptA
MKNFLNLLILTITVLISFQTYSQDQKKEGKEKRDKVKLQQADELEGSVLHGKKVVKFKGHVILEQRDVLIFCDSAFQYKGKEKNNIEAFGNIRIAEEDSIFIFGETLVYKDNFNKAILTGNVKVIKKGSRPLTISGDHLEYDCINKRVNVKGNVVWVDNIKEKRRKQIRFKLK